MPRYVDVGVKQVQTWLVRAPHLRGRRGASTMLTRATLDEQVMARLTNLPAVPHHEAGHVDGVISVRITAEETGHDLDEVCRTVEQHLVGHLRDKAPAAFLEAVWRDGESYADAYDRPVRCTDHPPAVSEWPGAKRCDWCHLWPAAHQIWDEAGEDFKEKDVCTDCERRSREEAAGRTTANRFRPLAEKRLLTKLAERSHTDPDLPDEFEELAKLGPIAADTTHLATIFADGNAIGALIAHLRASSTGRNKKTRRSDRNPAVTLAEAPRLIDDATWNAAAEAVVDITDPGSPWWRVIPHLVGGDDLLVSVPAHCAWQFLRTYLTSFVNHTTALARGDLAPSASAGVVIHHNTEPFSLVVDLADELLRKAKSEHAGQTAALAWQSITHDGSALVRDRSSITVDGLQNSWDALDRFATVAASQRQVIARVHREHGDVDAQLRRMRSGDHTLADLAAPFLNAPAAIPLPTALDIARWWWTR